MRTALQTRRPHGTEKRQAPTTAEAARSPIHRARDQVLSKSTLVRHEAVDSVSRRRSHQERSVSSRPRVVAFEEAALEWPTTDRTLGRDAPSLAPWRRWRGPTNVPLRANDRVRRQPTERTPIDAAMGSARSDLDAPGSRQPAVALDDGQDHMVHLYFPRVPVMVCTTTGTLVPRTSPAPCARQIHALPDGWVPVAVDRPRVPPRIARPTTCWSMCRPMLLNSTRRSTSEDVGSGMPPPVRTTLGQLGHETAALLPAWPGDPRPCALCPAGEIL
jgi:hypothetical protein